MLDTLTATPAAATVATRWRVEREAYGPLGGLFTAPVVPNAFTAEPEEAGRRVGTCVPEGFLL
jgi:hypothetical protein